MFAFRLQGQLTQETTTIQRAGTANISSPLTTAGAFGSKTTSMTYHASGLRKSFTYPANLSNTSSTGNTSTNGNNALGGINAGRLIQPTDTDDQQMELL